MKDKFLLPVTDGGVTNSYKKATHIGVDFGWVNVANCPVLAIQDGVVVDVFNSPTTGYAIVLQHNYSDGTHRWSGYIHLHKPVTLKIGDKVKQGQQIGIRGNTGKSNGTHLHIYVSTATNVEYTWTRMKDRCTFDPNAHFYLGKDIKYNKLSIYAKYTYLEDQIIYPKPVERNELVNQCEVIHDYLRLRKTPNGEIYERLCTKGIYNVLEKKEAGDYIWYKIAEDFWVASGGQRTIDLITIKEQILKLEKDLDEAKLAKEALEVEKKVLNEKLEDANRRLDGILELADRK